AEDGIRDLTVTGVQTCALPISRDRAALRPLEVGLGDPGVLEHRDALLADVEGDEELALGGRERRAAWRRLAARGALLALRGGLRSEERRVGKECRAGGARCDGE